MLKSSIGQTNTSIISLNNHQIDVGEIKNGGTLLYEFFLFNKSEKLIYFLKAENSNDLKILYTQKKLMPHDSLKLFIEFKPLKKGNFKKNIQLYLSDSDKPITLIFKGNVIELKENSMQECNDFSKKEIQVNKEHWGNQLSLFVVDSLENTPLQDVEVEVSFFNGTKMQLYSKMDGKIEFPATNSKITIHVKCFGYEEYLVTRIFSLNQKNNQIKLQKKIKISFEQKKMEYPPNTIHSDFSIELYKPNNLVFLLDISASMADEKKLPELKQVLKKLFEYLRPEDSISILTYSGFVDVLVESTTPKKILEEFVLIDTLKAFGQTSGRKGIFEGAKICKKHFNEFANNQIILISDGGFDLQPKDELFLGDLKKQRIILSTLALNPDKDEKKRLKKISKVGGGNFVNLIEDSNYFNLFVNEIKLQCKKNSNHY